MNNNYLKVKIVGRNVNNYIKWLIKQKINIINLKIIKYNELELIIDKKDYNVLSKYSKTYKITILKKYGKLRLIDIIKNNSIILSCLIFSIFFIYFLSHLIFSVDIIYNNKEIVEKISKELQKYNIKPLKFKKTVKYLDEVKSRILKENKDTLEWIEIEESGTKYIVKIVERKKEEQVKDYEYQTIVASKNAIIKNIKAYSGEKIKTVNQYVTKDEPIISGVLTKPDGTNLYKKATGSVFGEIWYKVNIEYPLYYQEESVTGKSKNVISIYFLNNKFSLFPYKKYKQFKLESNSLFTSNLLPIKIAKEKLYEVEITEEIYTEEGAINKAIKLTKEKMKEKNNKIVEIKQVTVLEKQNLNSKIKLNLFVSTIEDITKIIEIIPEKVEEKNE